MEYQLRDSGASIMITSPETASIALKAASLAGLSQDHVYLFTDPNENEVGDSATKLQPWTKLWSNSESVKSWSWKKITTPEEARSTTAIINYSSGYVQNHGIALG